MPRWVKGLLLSILALAVIIFYINTHQPTDSIPTAHYEQHYVTDTGATNIVAGIYLNYRVFDSLLETLMLLVSVAAVVALSWRREHE